MEATIPEWCLNRHGGMTNVHDECWYTDYLVWSSPTVIHSTLCSICVTVFINSSWIPKPVSGHQINWSVPWYAPSWTPGEPCTKTDALKIQEESGRVRTPRKNVGFLAFALVEVKLRIICETQNRWKYDGHQNGLCKSWKFMGALGLFRPIPTQGNWIKIRNSLSSALCLQLYLWHEEMA
jgi:hypothetical protein